ncbi:MAG: tail fiber protein [Actinomycetota bacterium]|nr:tail fiber protein [Actinomycetota bacterium]
MAEPFLSEIRIFSFNFPPKGWAFCNGQVMPINQNQALFALLGTTYGGNGQTTFGLPDLRDSAPIHVGNGHILGEKAGTTAVTITQQTMPQHIHFVNASSSNQGGSQSPAGRFLGAVTNMYHDFTTPQSINPATLGNVGGSQAHTNQQPLLGLNFCIALQGIFPSRN